MIGVPGASFVTGFAAHAEGDQAQVEVALLESAELAARIAHRPAAVDFPQALEADLQRLAQAKAEVARLAGDVERGEGAGDDFHGADAERGVHAQVAARDGGRVGERDVLRSLGGGAQHLQAVVDAEGIGVARDQPEAALADGVAARVVGKQRVALARRFDRGDLDVGGAELLARDDARPQLGLVQPVEADQVRLEPRYRHQLARLEIEPAGDEVVAQPGGAADPQFADSCLDEPDAYRSVADRLRRQDRPRGGLVARVIQAIDRGDGVEQILQTHHRALQRSEDRIDLGGRQNLGAIDGETLYADVLFGRGRGAVAGAGRGYPRRLRYLLQTLFALATFEVFLLLLQDRSGVGSGLRDDRVR